MSLLRENQLRQNSRPNQAHSPSSAPIRWFAGLSVSANCRRIESAIIGVHGRGSGAPIEIRRTISFDIPKEIVDSYNAFQENLYFRKATPEISIPVALYQHVIRELACVEEEAIEDLILESQLLPNDITAVSISDPGLHLVTPDGLHYQSLCDSEYLANQTGLNIIDAFSARDIAAQGQGGPLFALPSWIFLKSEQRDRILLDLGRTAKITFLPKVENSFSHQRIQYQDVMPCGSLFDALTWELTNGTTAVDLGGRLAVQGCQIPALLAAFRQYESSETQPEKNLWNPQGLPVAKFLEAATQNAALNFSLHDALCTASVVISETVLHQLNTMMAEFSTDTHLAPEILLTGTTRLHGVLLGQITSALSARSLPITLTPLGQLGVPTETFDALCTALLGLMHVDHIPAGLPHLTGSETAQTLGRLTAGSISAWTRLLREMADTKPSGRSLRAAS